MRNILIILTTLLFSCNYPSQKEVDKQLTEIKGPAIVVDCSLPGLIGEDAFIKVIDSSGVYHTIYSRTMCWKYNIGDTLKY